MSERIRDPRSYFIMSAAALWLAGFVCALTPIEAYEAESFLLAFMFCTLSAVFVLPAFGLARLREMGRIPLVWLALVFWGLAGVSAGFSEARHVSFIYFCSFSLFPLSFN